MVLPLGARRQGPTVAASLGPLLTMTQQGRFSFRGPSTVVPAQGLVQTAGLWPTWLGQAGAGAGEKAGWR